MSVIRAIVAFLICLLFSLVILDVGILLPDFAAGNGGDDWWQLVGAITLVNVVAAPVVAFGGLLGGFFVLSGNRENANSSRLKWMMKYGALAGGVYGALAFVLISQMGIAFITGACAGAIAGALSGTIWCVMVEQPRHA